MSKVPQGRSRRVLALEKICTEPDDGFGGDLPVIEVRLIGWEHVILGVSMGEISFFLSACMCSRRLVQGFLVVQWHFR